jgi:hypothetical protein
VGGKQYMLRAVDICFERGEGVSDGTWNRSQSSLVEHHLNPFHCGADRGKIAQVSLYDFYLPFKGSNITCSAGGEVVKNTHSFSLVNERLSQVGADKARTPRYKILGRFHPIAPPFHAIFLSLQAHAISLF